jgi:integrase
MRLTDLTIQRLKAEKAGQKTYFDDSLKGFGVRVSVGGSKSFIVMYGKRRKLKTLGRYPDLTLANARAKAKQFIGDLVGRTDVDLSSVSFEDARERFLDECRMRSKPSTVEGYTRLLNKHFPFDKPLLAVTRHDCMSVIEELKDTPGTAIHAYLVIRTLMNWAVGRGLIEVSPIPRWKFKTVSRSRVLTSDELKLVWNRAKEIGFPYGTLVQLLILTGQRRGEIAGLRRSWISDGVVTFPAGFCKNKRENVVPLGQHAKASLRQYRSLVTCFSLRVAGQTRHCLAGANTNVILMVHCHSTLTRCMIYGALSPAISPRLERPFMSLRKS